MSGAFLPRDSFHCQCDKDSPFPHIEEAEKIATVAKSGVNGPKYVVSHQH